MLQLICKVATLSGAATAFCGHAAKYSCSRAIIYHQRNLCTNSVILKCCQAFVIGATQTSGDYVSSNKRLSPAMLKPCSSRCISLSAKDVVASSPASLQPYLQLMRIDRPIGTWLVFLPCAWSISLATAPGHLPDLKLLTLCALGAFFMRGAGCTINDMWDKDFDSKVARTRLRPLASGRLSRKQALLFLSMPLSASLAILLTMNFNTIVLGFCAVLPCVIYPLMKRITYWPQVFLGLTFNWGVLIGWSAIQDGLHAAPVALYLSALSWTIVYDTIYAFQDREDDMKIGVKSTALRMGDSTKLWLSGFSATTVSCLAAAGVFSDQSWPYYLGVAYFASHLAHQLYTVDLSNPEDCGNKFRSNKYLGLIFCMSIIASTLLKKPNDKNEKELDYKRSASER